MERKIYQLTEKQSSKCHVKSEPMPSDEWFQEQWKKQHHGKLAGWGMMKRDYVLSAMTTTREYQQGLWQGRTDKARGLPYSEERNENTYNLGYYRGYETWHIGGQNGFDNATLQRFLSEYVTEPQEA